MADTLPQNAAPTPAILGWVLQQLGGDGFHHAVVAIAETGDLSAFCGRLVVQTTAHCFHAGRDRAVWPKCPACEEAAGQDRRAEGVRELAISSTYSRYG